MTTTSAVPASRASSITIVGAGTVGTHLARAFQAAGHDVRLAARHAESEKVRAAVDELGVDVATLDAASNDADFVVLAVPFAAVAETVRALGDIGGSVLVDATNTVADALPSGAATIPDVIAGVNPDATIVKAFNTIGAEAFTAPTIEDRPLFLPIAGDRPAADEVQSLASDIGFDAMVIGDRSVVHLLENFAELWIHLAFRKGLGRDFGFARLERPTPGANR